MDAVNSDSHITHCIARNLDTSELVTPPENAGKLILPREGARAPCLNLSDPCRVPVPDTAESEAFPRSTFKVVTTANTRQITGFCQSIVTTIMSGLSFPFSC